MLTAFSVIVPGLVMVATRLPGKAGVDAVVELVVNLDQRGGGTRQSSQIYRDAGQRVGAGARGERCGSKLG